MGKGTAYHLWQVVKQRAGYYEDGDTSKALFGVGYTDVNDPAAVSHIPAEAKKHEYIISAEWTFGAINMCLVLAEQYDDINSSHHNEFYARSLRADAHSMISGVNSIGALSKVDDSHPLIDLESRDENTAAYRYANRRYNIPFGWWANPIDSLCSTAWGLMVANRFNPFILGGSYTGEVIPRDTTHLSVKNSRTIMQLKDVQLPLTAIVAKKK